MPNQKNTQLKKFSKNTYCINFEPAVSIPRWYAVVQTLLCIGVYLLVAWSYLGAVCK